MNVSVIIPTFNRAGQIGDCLAAMLSQSVPPTEIIVVNDGSTDETRDVLREYAGRIRYFEQENAGKSSALNRGLELATGDWIWIFDDDDIPLPDALKTHLAAIEREPNIDFTYSGYFLAEFNSDLSEWAISRTFKAYEGHSDDLFLALAFGAKDTETGHLHQDGMLVRRKCYDVAGPFDESLPRSIDLDMNLRLCRQFRGLRIDGQTFVIKCHKGLRGPASDRHEYTQRDEKWIETDRQAFRKLYHNTPLDRFLGRSPDRTRKRNDHLRALLNRARAMARLNLKDLVQRDLDEFQTLVCSDRLLLDEAIIDQALLLEVLCERRGFVELARLIKASLKRIVRIRGNKQWGKYIAKCHYWRTIEAAKRGNFNTTLSEASKTLRSLALNL